MAAVKGSLLVVKLGTDTFAMARSTSATINGETVDITTKGSAGWRELLSGAGIVSMSISLSGVYTDETYEHTLRSYAMDNSANSFTLIDGNGDDYTGNFIVTSYETGGEYNGEQTFSATLESAGAITFTQAV